MGAVDDVNAIARQALRGWARHDTSRAAAALAYFGTLGAAPTLVAAIIVGTAIGREGIVANVLDALTPIVGPGTSDMLHAAATGILSRSAFPIAPLLVALVASLFAATGLVVHVRRALVSAWEVPEPVRSPLAAARAVVVERALALGALAVLFVIASTGLSLLAVFAMTSIAGAHIGGLLESIIGDALLAAVIALVYRAASEGVFSWAACAIGGVTCATAMVLGVTAAGWYFASGWFLTIYGAAGSLVVLLLLFYWGGQAFLAGAEIVRAVAEYGTARTGA